METKRRINPLAEEILDLYFPVLDHGFVALVDYMGTDEEVERAARVSYQAGTRKTSETRTLLRYLQRHHHTTPSEMVELKFHCAMPIFIARQWIRHRTANVNEMSGRYSLLPMLFYTPTEANFRRQSKANKQGRSEEGLGSHIYEIASGCWNAGREFQKESYEWLTTNDVANELARIDLPLSTYTQWYWKIDLHNLMHFLTLRVDSHAQWEFREYGKVMAGMMKRVAPLSHEAWVDYEVCGRRFSRAEMGLIRAMAAVEEVQPPVNADMSAREIEEFREKLLPMDVPNFDLDLSLAKTGSYFEELAKAATPEKENK